MSVKAANWAQQQTAGAAGRKATLLLLADIADASGLLWAGVEYLAPILECDRTTVMRHLADLEERGLILRIERRKVNGARTSMLTLLAPTGERGVMADPREHPAHGALVADALSRDLHEPKSGFAQTQVASCNTLSRDLRPKPLVEPSEGTVEPSALVEKTDLNEVFEFWQTSCRKPRAKLTTERRRAIRARMAEGYTFDDIRQGITGASVNPPRDRDSGTVYDDLVSICRNGSQLERYMQRAQPQLAGQVLPIKGRHSPSDLLRAIDETEAEEARQGGRPA